MKKCNHIDWVGLWQRVTADFALSSSSPHGPDHWQRVEQNGLMLAEQTGARRDVVRLFAVFHDSKRAGEFDDPDHGWRGAEFARQLRGRLFDIDDDGFRLLFLACTIHPEPILIHDATIATCLDADRLDLARVGIVPDPEFMNTVVGAGHARKLRRQSPALRVPR
jgi:uncharacterized protein